MPAVSEYAGRSRARNIAVLAASAALAVVLAGQGSAQAQSRVALFYLDRHTSSYAMELVGAPYAWGGTGPAFDCSGLAQHVYAMSGYQIPRTAEEQFLFFRQISQKDAWGGDLVFFHDYSGYVYHTGIYEGGNQMVSALNYQYGVMRTPVSLVWGYVTFGTISH
jgi:NlpC/P60 family